MIHENTGLFVYQQWQAVTLEIRQIRFGPASLWQAPATPKISGRLGGGHSSPLLPLDDCLVLGAFEPPPSNY